MNSLRSIAAALPALHSSMLAACKWLVDVAQVRTDQLTIEGNRPGLAHRTWKGSFRGEYSVADRKWDFFCPTWHGGQAIKALAQAYQLTGDRRLLRSAEDAAEFLLQNQINTGPDAGLILAYEDIGDKVFTSAVLESLDGLLVLADVTGQQRYRDSALSAARWCLERTWINGQGLLRDLYDPHKRKFIDDFVVTRENAPGRPLADDSIFLKAFDLTGEARYRDVFYEILHRLLRDERPAGNWVDYGPCCPKTGECHPRHAYWWGLPMLDAYQHSREKIWLDAAVRSGEWYVKAQRTDGGLFRFTDLNFKTACFEHATSGICCAAILWMRLFRETRDPQWLEPTRKALSYAMSVQFTEPQDPNLKGCVLERLAPPDGTDRNPYYIRDLATIFFVQAAAQLLTACKAEPPVVSPYLQSAPSPSAGNGGDHQRFG